MELMVKVPRRDKKMGHPRLDRPTSNEEKKRATRR